MKALSTIILLIALQVSASAKLVLPKILGHNMVLQQGEPVAIWGWANPGEEVTVHFKNQTKKSVAANDGKWSLYLNPLKASFEEAVLKVSTKNEAIVLNNILVGEVWLCSGQSNMEFAMRKLINLKPPENADWPVNEVAEAKNKSIRIFLSERKKMNPDSLHKGWTTAEGEPLRHFSAVGYFFGKQLAAQLKVPIGMISASIPGSQIEPWMPAEAMASQAFFKENKGTRQGRIGGDPGKFYTTMIEPMIPFTLKGFLWYQGESNCFLNERLEYSYKMKSLIDYWRKQWNNDQLPFYYIQIAPYYYSKSKDRPYTIHSEAEFWEAQAAVLKMHNTAMIATIDLNDDPADLHPVNKWDVGKRLANTALSKTYKTIKAEPMGPVFKSAQKVENGFLIDFYYKGKGLKSRNGNTLSGFEIRNDQGDFVPAEAVIKNNKVWVTNTTVKNPTAVRYNWQEDAKPALYNSDELPAISFRTSDSVIDQFKP